jgi:hypothetical protein
MLRPQFANCFVAVLGGDLSDCRCPNVTVTKGMKYAAFDHGVGDCATWAARIASAVLSACCQHLSQIWRIRLCARSVGVDAFN